MILTYIAHLLPNTYQSARRMRESTCHHRNNAVQYLVPIVSLIRKAVALNRVGAKGFFSAWAK